MGKLTPTLITGVRNAQEKKEKNKLEKVDWSNASGFRVSLSVLRGENRSEKYFSPATRLITPSGVRPDRARDRLWARERYSYPWTSCHLSYNGWSGNSPEKLTTSRYRPVKSFPAICRRSLTSSDWRRVTTASFTVTKFGPRARFRRPASTQETRLNVLRGQGASPLESDKHWRRMLSG